MQYRFCARTDTGRVRANNEDAVLFDAQSCSLVLADGMGGYNAGEVASGMAASTILEALSAWVARVGVAAQASDVRGAMQASVDQANRAVYEAAHTHAQYAGMGTTVVVGLFHAGVLWVGHIGDSRCYRLRGNTLEQLSNDHTVIQELLDQGAISQAEAAEHPQRSMLTQALRGDGDVTPVLQMYEVKKGDRYLLCSDGLSGVLTEKEIKIGLKKSDKADAVKFLVDATYVNGAPDNVTVLIADISDSSTTPTSLLGAAHD